jgi:hypothetical protein
MLSVLIFHWMAVPPRAEEYGAIVSAIVDEHDRRSRRRGRSAKVEDHGYGTKVAQHLE